MRGSLIRSHHVKGRLGTITSHRTACLSYVSSAPEFAEVPDFLDYGPNDNTKTLEKESALQQALSSLSGDFCKESRLSMRRFFNCRRASVISTGSLMLDQALGVGGLPKGRMVEIYGKEASGKTTLSLHIIKEAQKVGGYCAYLDVENALDLPLLESMGINTEKLLISSPKSAEQVLSVVNTLASSGSVDVIVVDSVAALVPQRELDVPIGLLQRDFQAETMTRALRKIHHSLSRSETLIIFVNQVRHKVKAELGIGHAEEVTCGGNALRFYAAVRLKISRMQLVKIDDVATGLSICVDVVKNKLAPAAKRVEMEIEFGKGLRIEAEVLKLACENGIILNEGGSYFIEGEVLHCASDAEQYLRDKEDVLESIIARLRSKLVGK
uniref:Uncharacterized protein n=1 Tax=Kalanchoe fedtschenkoi TaxID=63787 RepID=A0A7N0UAC7_KALFE